MDSDQRGFPADPAREARRRRNITLQQHRERAAATLVEAEPARQQRMDEDPDLPLQGSTLPRWNDGNDRQGESAFEATATTNKSAPPRPPQTLEADAGTEPAVTTMNIDSDPYMHHYSEQPMASPQTGRPMRTPSARPRHDATRKYASDSPIYPSKASYKCASSTYIQRKEILHSSRNRPSMLCRIGHCLSIEPRGYRTKTNANSRTIRH